MSPRRGPVLPYSVVAGVTPVRSSWLLVSAKMAGSIFAPEAPRVFDSFGEVLSESPAYAVVVVNAPIGYVDEPGNERRGCDLEVRALLGRRASTVHSSPSRATLFNVGFEKSESLDAVTKNLLPRYREVAAQVSQYRQRVVYEGHPELSFFQLNSGSPLRWSKNTQAGLAERLSLLDKKIPDIAGIIEDELIGAPKKHLLDAYALLWTARRVFGHAATRVPSAAQWDSEGLRVEMVY